MAKIFRVFSQILEVFNDEQTEAEKYERQINIVNALGKALTEKDNKRRNREDRIRISDIMDDLTFKLYDIISTRCQLASNTSEWPWSIIEADLGLTSNDTTLLYWMWLAREIEASKTVKFDVLTTIKKNKSDISYAAAKSATVDREDGNADFWRRVLKIIYPQEK